MLGLTYSIAFVPTREDAMTTYIMLASWTDQGIQKIKDSPRRFDMAKQALGEMGGQFKSIFLTMGEYDLIGCVFRARKASGSRHVGPRFHTRSVQCS